MTINSALLLSNMGVEYCSYALDTIYTFSISNKFITDQQLIYKGLLKAYDS